MKPPTGTLCRPYRQPQHLRGVCALSGHCSIVMRVCLGNIRAPSCTAVPATPFFIFEARGPQRDAGHMAAPEPSVGRRGSELLDTWRRQSHPRQGGGAQSCCTHGHTRALLRSEAGFRAAGYVEAPEPSSAERRGPELLNTWRHRVLLSREAGSRATGHMAALEPSSTGRWGLKLLDTWRHQSPPQQDMRQHLDSRLAPCLGLVPVRGGTWSVGYRQEETLSWKRPEAQIRR
jgi:hypothetical protein